MAHVLQCDRCEAIFTKQREQFSLDEYGWKAYKSGKCEINFHILKATDRYSTSTVPVQVCDKCIKELLLKALEGV